MAIFRSGLARILLSLAILSPLTGCGGGGGSVAVGVAVTPTILPLDLRILRTGPEVVQLDWSFDPDVAFYEVVRDGILLAQTSALTLIDARR